MDKWLWAVRLYRSRSLATSACNAGHVKVGGHSVKASRDVHIGEVICALAGRVNRTVKVLGLLERRIGAKLVAEFLEDQTPREEYERARAEAAAAAEYRPHGFSRPTKKQRRAMIGIFDQEQD